MVGGKGSLRWRKRFFSYVLLERKRRTGAVLLHDILVAAERGAKKTHIMFGSNMNPVVLGRYLDFAVERGLLEQRAYIYFTTDKGREFLRSFGRLEELVDEVGRVEQRLAGLVDG